MGSRGFFKVGFLMKFTLRHDTRLAAEELFTAISDFPRMERMLTRRKVQIARLDPAREPGAGIAWDIAFDFKGKRRELRMDVGQFDRPERVVFYAVSEPVTATITMTVIALTPRKSRVMFEVDARPRHMRARLLFQTAKLGKAQLDRKFADKVGGFLTELTGRAVDPISPAPIAWPAADRRDKRREPSATT